MSELSEVRKLSEVVDASEKFVLYSDELCHYSGFYPEAKKKSDSLCNSQRWTSLRSYL